MLYKLSNVHSIRWIWAKERPCTAILGTWKIQIEKNKTTWVTLCMCIIYSQLQSHFFVVLLKNEISVLENFRQHKNSKIICIPIYILQVGRRNLSSWCLYIKRRMGKKKILIDCFSIFWMVKYGKMLYSKTIELMLVSRKSLLWKISLYCIVLKKALEFDESTGNLEIYWKVLNPKKVHEQHIF